MKNRIPIVQENILDLMSSPIPTKELTSIKAQLLRSYETQIRENDGWMGFFVSALRRGESPLKVLEYKPMVEEMEADFILSRTNDFYSPQRAVELVMFPQKGA